MGTAVEKAQALIDAKWGNNQLVAAWCMEICEKGDPLNMWVLGHKGHWVTKLGCSWITSDFEMAICRIMHFISVIAAYSGTIGIFCLKRWKPGLVYRMCTG